MKMLPRQPMTLAQFLDWEDRQELRYEFDGFQPIAMTRGTQAHAAIQVSLITALNRRRCLRPRIKMDKKKAN